MAIPCLVIILLIALLLASISYLGEAQSNCVGKAECFCGPCPPTIQYYTQNGVCIKVCTCNCQSPTLPFQTNPLQAPPPVTKSNPQPPPKTTKPNPSFEAPQAPPKTKVVTPIVSTPKPSTDVHHPSKPLDPLSNCEVPILAPYAVQSGKYCWCQMEGYYNVCFEKIWRATTNYVFMEVDNNCCDAFWAAYKTCGGMIDPRYRYFLYRLQQHCS